MAAKQPAAAKSIVKREPVLIGSAIVTLLSTALYVAPSISPKLKLPDSAQKAIGLLFTAAGAFGIRSLVKPA